jgi:hypothetical protein
MPSPKAFFLLVFFVALSGCGSGNPRRIALLAPGTRNGTNAPRSVGGGWLALCQVGEDRWELYRTPVRTKRVRDEQIDQSGEKSGREYRTKFPSALCVMRHPSLAPGRVEAAEFQPTPPSKVNLINEMGLGVKVLFSIDSYELSAAASGKKASHYTLSVSTNGGPPKPLDEFERGIQPAFESAVLIWAGDLNRDGVADFLFEHGSFNKRGQSLFLSQRADGGYKSVGRDFWTEY